MTDWEVVGPVFDRWAKYERELEKHRFPGLIGESNLPEPYGHRFSHTTIPNDRLIAWRADHALLLVALTELLGRDVEHLTGREILYACRDLAVELERLRVQVTR